MLHARTYVTWRGGMGPRYACICEAYRDVMESAAAEFTKVDKSTSQWWPC